MPSIPLFIWAAEAAVAFGADPPLDVACQYAVLGGLAGRHLAPTFTRVVG